MRMEFTSPRTTALNQMLHSSPITTSPTTVQLSAKKQSLPNFGETPLTGFIKAILRIANVYQYFQFNTLFLKKVHVRLLSAAYCRCYFLSSGFLQHSFSFA